MSNRNVNMNQFALPGMEEHAHPGAKFLSEGGKFHMSTDYSYGDAGQGTRVPYEHNLIAFGKRGQTVGQLHWAGSGQERQGRSGHYPGEVTWVNRPTPRTRSNPGGRDYVQTSKGDWRRPPRQHKGIMTGMFRMAHHLGLSDDTVPVHSPERTHEGESWSKRVGPSELRPRANDHNWRPPVGIHPYEQRAQASMQSAVDRREPGPGQHALFNVRGRGEAEHSVGISDVIKNWIK